ncbi:MAG TPA: hypothetical protein VE753_09670 [Gaiellaceae bacterium]|jgi:hypothetical protein|nr:hypothetical protein [Gaiellaceae bacterium]
MAEPTYEDAQLVIQLAQLGTQMVHPKARGWIWSDEFVADGAEFFEKFPPGSDEFNYVSSVAAWHETVATLWKRGLVNEELLFDWLWVPGIWERTKDVLVAMRGRSGTSQLWENFEAMAEAQALVATPA